MFCGLIGGSLVCSKEVDGSDALAMSSSSGMTIGEGEGASLMVDASSEEIGDGDGASSVVDVSSDGMTCGMFVVVALMDV